MRRGEGDFERILGAAFDRLPEPDATRLRAIEERLSRAARRAPEKRKSRWFYWWLVAGLAATGAAAWWTGEIWTAGSSKSEGEHSAPAVGEVIAPEREASKHSEQKDAGSETEPNNNSKSSSAIYRREAY